MKALLAIVSEFNLGTYRGYSFCGKSINLFGSYTPTNQFAITNEKQALEVTFSIKGRGMIIILDGSGGV